MNYTNVWNLINSYKYNKLHISYLSKQYHYPFRIHAHRLKRCHNRQPHTTDYKPVPTDPWWLDKKRHLPNADHGLPGLLTTSVSVCNIRGVHSCVVSMPWVIRFSLFALHIFKNSFGWWHKLHAVAGAGWKILRERLNRFYFLGALMIFDLLSKGVWHWVTIILQCSSLKHMCSIIKCAVYLKIKYIVVTLLKKDTSLESSYFMWCDKPVMSGSEAKGGPSSRKLNGNILVLNYFC